MDEINENGVYIISLDRSLQRENSEIEYDIPNVTFENDEAFINPGLEVEENIENIPTYIPNMKSEKNEAYTNPVLEVEDNTVELSSEQNESSNQVFKNDVKPSYEFNGSPLLNAPFIRHRSIYLPPFLENNRELSKEWTTDIDFLKSRILGLHDTAPRKLKSYYKSQEELVKGYTAINDGKYDENVEEKELKKRKAANVLAKFTILLNIILVSAQAVAAYLSGSISIISSLVDSSLDMVSGIIIWYSCRKMGKRKPYQYPQGQTRIEPVSLIILSVVMGLAAVQLIIGSIQAILNNTVNPEITLTTLIISLSNIGIKLVMFLICRNIDSSSVQALAQDHRNDMLLNAVALTAGYIGYKVWLYADPTGAILIAIYIIFNWWKTGKEQVRFLIGYTADTKFLQLLTYLAIQHSEKIKQIDTVRAFHFGNNFIVEVDIVLPEEMILREAHDIGESLQQKIENLPNVERAFVHLDYEVRHNPGSEHKIV